MVYNQLYQYQYQILQKWLATYYPKMAYKLGNHPMQYYPSAESRIQSRLKLHGIPQALFGNGTDPNTQMLLGKKEPYWTFPPWNFGVHHVFFR